MGITDQIIAFADERGGKQEKAAIVKNLLQHTTLSIAEITRLVNVSRKFVINIKKTLP